MIRTLNRNNENQQGFSLLEVLVAFSILSILLGVLLNIFSTGVRTAQLTGEYARAIQIAESLLTTVSAEQFLQADQRSGVIDEIYDWTIVIEPFEPDDKAWNQELSETFPFRIQVDVSWAESAKERTFSLVTLRLSEKEDLSE